MKKSKIVIKFEKFLKEPYTFLQNFFTKLDKKEKNNNNFFISNSCFNNFLFNFTKKELIAPEDRGAFFVIVKAPQGSGFNFTKRD